MNLWKKINSKLLNRFTFYTITMLIIFLICQFGIMLGLFSADLAESRVRLGIAIIFGDLDRPRCAVGAGQATRSLDARSRR